MHLDQGLYLTASRSRIAIVFAVSLFVGCGTSSDETLPTASISAPEDQDSSELSLQDLANPDAIIANPEDLPQPQPRKNPYPEVMIRTSLGNIKVRLDAEHASETVDNFLGNYVQREFYDGTILHYVERGFIAIGGGFTTGLDAKEARAPIRNEARNAPKNTKGTIAMSRQVEYVDSATSQFFFNLADNPTLDHAPDGGDEGYGYCVFGNVVEGMDVLERIAGVEVGDKGDSPKMPVEQIVIESIRLID